MHNSGGSFVDLTLLIERKPDDAQSSRRNANEIVMSFAGFAETITKVEHEARVDLPVTYCSNGCSRRADTFRTSDGLCKTCRDIAWSHAQRGV